MLFSISFFLLSAHFDSLFKNGCFLHFLRAPASGTKIKAPNRGDTHTHTHAKRGVSARTLRVREDGSWKRATSLHRAPFYIILVLREAHH